MLPVVRVDKRIPGGSLWQRRSGYRLADQDGLARVYQPAGTPWWNPLGGWTQEVPGVSVFGDLLPFAISCHGVEGNKRFYIDVVRWNRVGPTVIEYLDLYLDVMIDPAGVVSEKDEHQLVALVPAEQLAVRATRDAIRTRIAAGDPLFDPSGPLYAVSPDVFALPPVPLEPSPAGPDQRRTRGP
ncbi:MAG TPA: DUF402 domain-containing protein [Candidatus Limnocylindria bacterium]|jgi:hypothetical protein